MLEGCCLSGMFFKTKPAYWKNYKKKCAHKRIQMKTSLLFTSLYLLYLLAVIVYVELVLSVAVINYECILPVY